MASATDAGFAKAQASTWPMYKAALDGLGHDGAYPGPDRRWSKAVIAWLDWQLKGDQRAALLFRGPDCGLCVNPKWVVRTKNIK